MESVVLQKLVVVLCFVGLTSSASAHENQISHSIEINAPAAQVWELVGDFHAVHKWLPGIEDTVSDDGTEQGSMRELVLANGASLHERLERLDAAQMSLSYSIPDATHDTAVLPVKGYSSEISVLDAGATSVVIWAGRFQEAGGKKDADVIGILDGLYRAGLENLKSILE